MVLSLRKLRRKRHRDEVAWLWESIMRQSKPAMESS